MKQLKYIKLFEAFESAKLTKILKYIDTESKKVFIRKLESISKQYDFPMSNFSDDMFQYLPFKKALDVNIEESEKQCRATSKELFLSSGIEGEVCQNGKIKRLWGTGERIVSCNQCNGTGFEIEKSELKIIKFWFTSDGKFVSNTGVDGKIRESNINQEKKLHKGYTVINTILRSSARENQVREIPHLTKVFFKSKSSDRGEISTIFIDSGDVFCIQNTRDGGTPADRNWRTYGRYSWNISAGDYWSIQILKATEDEDSTDNNSSYNHNVSLKASAHTSGLTVSEYNNVETEIKDAHFALVLNMAKLKSGEYEKTSIIKDNREKLKSGSKLSLTDDEVRNQNIERYISLMVKKADIVGDASNIKNLVSKGIGGRWSLFVLISSARYESNFSTISELYYKMIRDATENGADDYIGLINERIRMIYQISSEKTTKISKNITEIKKNLIKEGQSERYLPIIEGLERISLKFFNKLVSSKFETIEDLEIARQKMISLKSFFNNSLYFLDNLSNFIEYLRYDDIRRPYSMLVDTWRVDDYYDGIIGGIKIVEKLVDRL